MSEDEDDSKATVVHMARIRLRMKVDKQQQLKPVDVATQATRLRYMAEYLEFVSDYVGAGLPAPQREQLKQESAPSLKAFRAHVPPVTKRAKLNARVGLSEEEQQRLMQVVHPDSPTNPWNRRYVRLRNWVIVMVLSATGRAAPALRCSRT